MQTLTPAMHIAMKAVVANFYGAELREKDHLDLAALHALPTLLSGQLTPEGH